MSPFFVLFQWKCLGEAHPRSEIIKANNDNDEAVVAEEHSLAVFTTHVFYLLDIPHTTEFFKPVASHC